VDEALLLWINQGWANHGLDILFATLSSRRGFALPLAVVLLLTLLWRWRKAGVQLWLMMMVVVGLGDFLGNNLKPVFAQHRPCYTLAAEVRQLHYLPGQPCGANLTGMPSNHALNGFAVAAFLTLVLRRRAWGITLFTLAALVALSRVYLAKHYPSQIAVGALLGTSWGLITAWLGLKYLPFVQRFRPRGATENNDHDQD
jgi:undecaprenyl-diphosphatase